ncbi:thioredoxin protein [Skermanella stibiiresistens SB22]|uniref:Thioredoxin protein n=1 Tax=Skermanella stibiiresistens SB22 TaxID=1385369 RepID=W9HBZ5_9PROT|nr:thioredoxin family protein [Skermanella stibiiresistens]EWY42207.1 thioredoxin protein [Skermanella stibiiresistens SB22]
MADAQLSDFFNRFPMRPIASAELDAALAEEATQPLTILFLWGRNCPNCDIAKRAMMVAPERFQLADIRWFHDNVYDDFDMATRFGVHGIPVFFLFHGRRQLGKITSWPGPDAFLDVIAQQLRRISAT